LKTRTCRNRPYSSNHSAHGVALIWVTLWLTFLIVVVGLGIDVGLISLGMHQLQNATDAAALAGAQLVKFSTEGEVQTACQAVSEQNTVYGNDVALLADDIIRGYWSSQTRTFTPSEAGPFNAVRVIARRTSAINGPLSLLFGQFADHPTADVTVDAIAWSVGTTGAGLIALSEVDTGLSLSGGSSAIVNNGDVQVNSVDAVAGYANGSFSIDADEINVVGEVGGPADWDAEAIENGFSLNTAPAVAPITDPLLDLPEPDLGDFPAFIIDVIDGVPTPIPYDNTNNNYRRLDISTGDDITIEPGYYPNGFNISGGKLTLMPGVYALGTADKSPGESLNINGGTLEANGVMLYLTHGLPDSKGDVHYGKLAINGSPIITLTPMNSDPEFGDVTPDTDNAWYNPGNIYDGISIFQARENDTDNTSPPDSRYEGTSSELSEILGTLYFPDNLLTVSGDHEALGEQLIADRIALSGGADVIINYNGRFFVKGFRSMLVE
jgi:Flp pilus assembly protein TadG